MQQDNRLDVHVDYKNFLFPENARRLQPAVWQEGNTFCVLSGPDSMKGIFGFGSTLDSALTDWNRNLVERLTCGEPGLAPVIRMPTTKIAC